MTEHWFQAEPDFLGGRSRRSGRRSVRRGGKFMAFGGDLNAREIYALGGSGVRGRSRGRSVRRSRGGQYPFDDQGRAFMALGGSGVRSRGRGRGRRGGGSRSGRSSRRVCRSRRGGGEFMRPELL